MGAQNTRRSSEVADAIDILRAINVAQAAAARTITLPVPRPATGTPGDDPAADGPAGEEPPGQAGCASSVRPPGALARPADTMITGGDASGPPATTASSSPGRPRRAHAKNPPLFAGARRLITTGPWPLAAILTVQAGLSLRLVWSNTAFADEALYLWAGRLEIAHWLHGTPIPAFPTYFSGALAVYPPLGALANDVGGLAGARILSLFFMLGATCCLYGTARRLFGRTAALLAAALFVCVASTQFMGAFATYDALAVFLAALATWLGVRSAGCRPLPQVGMLLGVGATLAVADAAKYAATLFDPVVVAVVALAVWRAAGLKKGISATVIAVSALYICLTVAIKAAGAEYWRGITYTTLARNPDRYGSAGAILFVGFSWIIAVLFLALIGLAAVLLRRSPAPQRLLGLVLFGAGLLAPLEQARIHDFTSLFKHVGYGAWFTAMLAAYALTSLADAVPPRRRGQARIVALAVIATAAIPGYRLAWTHYQGWPNVSQALPIVQRVIDEIPPHSPVIGFDDGNVLQYYDPKADTLAFANTWYFTYAVPGTGQVIRQNSPLAYAEAIQHRYFSMITLENWDSSTQDKLIAADVKRYGGYRLVAVVPYNLGPKRSNFRIWVRASGAHS